MSTGYRTAAKRVAPLVMASAAGVLGMASAARANLNIALLLPGGGSTHTFTATDLTTPIEIDVWAQITPNATYDTGANGGNLNDYPGTASEYAFGVANYGVFSSQVSNTLSSKGGLVSAALEAWANQVGALAGPISDANGDGANDLGGVYPPAGSSTLLASAKGNTAGGTTANAVTPASDVQALPGGGFEFLIEKLYYQAVAADFAPGRIIDYNVLTQTKGTNGASWTEDGDVGGSTSIINGNGGQAASLYGPGTGVALVNSPEPATISLLGMATAGLLVRRRKA